jgi:hypothetical protein
VIRGPRQYGKSTFPIVAPVRRLFIDEITAIAGGQKALLDEEM